MIDEARAWIAAARSVVAFSGAGLSAESGIATFRDPGTDGHWTKHDPQRLASPEGFAEDPDLVISWYAHRRRRLATAVPNAAHAALARRGEIRNVTQNVDDLLERAGARDVLHLHGRIGFDRCHARCGYEAPVDLGDPPESPGTCPECGASLRPSVVWFGESLPPDVWREADDACRTCDLLLVIGTSAVVYPAAGLVDLARAHGARAIVVNTEPSGAAADLELLGPAGDVVPALLG